ncbi:ClbS/DfsB family four-helix bundle protein [uncultured Muriicola sp.]|uniref:ClbS/DfsB family four-helix bundle protein n=1 Tax=uncultured Muriicola sp. TaxID=1583102 RepID=UPI0026088C02|nr:ClbS/DfsB family four-helix bundle protein [uncultured Muriicola sp.]
MSRPASKTELLNKSKASFQNLNGFIEQLSIEQQQKEFPIGIMNRNIRDVLMHLHHWHLMFLKWYKVGMSGQKPVMPAKGYTWKTTPDLNQWILKNYQDIPLKDAKNLLKESHRNVEKIIQHHSDIELFEKKRYKWTGTTSLGAYLVSTTSSHYEWALRLIKRARK